MNSRVNEEVVAKNANKRWQPMSQGVHRNLSNKDYSWHGPKNTNNKDLP